MRFKGSDLLKCLEMPGAPSCRAAPIADRFPYAEDRPPMQNTTRFLLTETEAGVAAEDAPRPFRLRQRFPRPVEPDVPGAVRRELAPFLHRVSAGKRIADGTQHVELAVNDLLDRLAALIPPPRHHRHRYHGIVAPNAALRHGLTMRTGQPSHPPSASEPVRLSRRPASNLWSALIAHIYDVSPAIVSAMWHRLPMRFVSGRR